MRSALCLKLCWFHGYFVFVYQYFAFLGHFDSVQLVPEIAASQVLVELCGQLCVILVTSRHLFRLRNKRISGLRVLE